MCELCDLSNGEGGFIITRCRTCNLTMVVLREHRAEFSFEERMAIKEIFHDRQIRWEMRQITDHAHCHILNPVPTAR